MIQHFRELVGKHVTLIEMPDGYTSGDYPVRIGCKYKVTDISGSNLCIELPDGITAHIHRGRFKECR